MRVCVAVACVCVRARVCVCACARRPPLRGGCWKARGAGRHRTDENVQAADTNQLRPATLALTTNQQPPALPAPRTAPHTMTTFFTPVHVGARTDFRPAQDSKLTSERIHSCSLN